MDLLQRIGEVRSPVDLALIGYLSRLASEHAPDNPLCANGLLTHIGISLGRTSNLSNAGPNQGADLRQPLTAITYRKGDLSDRQRQLEEGLREVGKRRHEVASDRLYKPAGDLKAERQKLNPRPLGEYVTRNKRVVVLAPPGGGKSEELKWLCRRQANETAVALAAQRVQATQARLPVFVRLPQLARGLQEVSKKKNFQWLRGVGCDDSDGVQDSWVGKLAAAVLWVLVKGDEPRLSEVSDNEKLKLPALLAPLVWRRLIRPVPDQLLICFDALDEVDSKIRAGLISAMRGYCSAVDVEGNVEIWTSSRAYGYAGSPLWSPSEQADEKDRFELELMPLTATQRETFVGEFFRNQRAKGIELIKQLRSNVQVAEMIKNPLSATLVCALVASADPEQKEIELPLRRGEVYRRVLEMLLGANELRRTNQSAAIHPEDLKEEMETAIACLRRVAASVYGDVLNGGFEKLPFVDGWWNKLPKHNRLKRRLGRNSLLDYFRRTAVITAVGDGRFMFIHRTFQEYLIASFHAHEAVELQNRNAIEQIDKWSWDTERAEVIRLFIGEMGEFDASEGSKQISADLLRELIDRWSTPVTEIGNPHKNDLFCHRLCLTTSLVEVKQARRRTGGDLADVSGKVCLSILQEFLWPTYFVSGIDAIESHPLISTLPSVAILNGNVGSTESPVIVTEWIENVLGADPTMRSWGLFFIKAMGDPAATETIAELLCEGILRGEAGERSHCFRALQEIILACSKLKNWQDRILPCCLHFLTRPLVTESWTEDDRSWAASILDRFREDLSTLPEWPTQILPVLLKSLLPTSAQGNSLSYHALTILDGLHREEPVEFDFRNFAPKPRHSILRVKEWEGHIRPALFESLKKCRRGEPRAYAPTCWKIIDVLCRHGNEFTTWSEWPELILPVMAEWLEVMDAGPMRQSAHKCFQQIDPNVVHLRELQSKILPFLLGILQPRPASVRDEFLWRRLFKPLWIGVSETAEWSTQILPRLLDCLEQPADTWPEFDDHLQADAGSILNLVVPGRLLPILPACVKILGQPIRAASRHRSLSIDIICKLGGELIHQSQLWKTLLEYFQQPQERWPSPDEDLRENVITLFCKLGRDLDKSTEWETQILPILLGYLEKGEELETEFSQRLHRTVIRHFPQAIVSAAKCEKDILPRLHSLLEPPESDRVAAMHAVNFLNSVIERVPNSTELLDRVLPALLDCLEGPKNDWSRADPELRIATVNLLIKLGREVTKLSSWHRRLLPSLLECLEQTPSTWPQPDNRLQGDVYTLLSELSDFIPTLHRQLLALMHDWPTRLGAPDDWLRRYLSFRFFEKMGRQKKWGNEWPTLILPKLVELVEQPLEKWGAAPDFDLQELAAKFLGDHMSKPEVQSLVARVASHLANRNASSDFAKALLVILGNKWRLFAVGGEPPTFAVIAVDEIGESRRGKSASTLGAARNSRRSSAKQNSRSRKRLKP